MSNPLQRKRNAVGLTQAQIAKLVGATERGYRKYEASEDAKTKSIPDILTAIRIADALGVQDLRELWQVTNQVFKGDRHDNQNENDRERIAERSQSRQK